MSGRYSFHAVAFQLRPVTRWELKIKQSVKTFSRPDLKAFVRTQRVTVLAQICETRCAMFSSIMGPGELSEQLPSNVYAGPGVAFFLWSHTPGRINLP